MSVAGRPPDANCSCAKGQWAVPTVRPREWARRVASGSGAPAALLLAACATTLEPGEPKVVAAYEVPAYALHEECLRLARGDRVDYSFRSTAPVTFGIRYHEGNASVFPVSRDATLDDAGIYAAFEARDYCLAWEAGPAAALIDYRIRVRRAEVVSDPPRTRGR